MNHTGMTITFEKQPEFWHNPEDYLSVDELGDLHIQWFYNRYAALRMLKNMPIFDKAYKVLSERGNFSRANAFGEMHGDGYLWIEKHPTVQVIVEEWQSFRHIHIKETFHYHIREIAYAYNYPEYRKSELKNIHISKFRKQGFKPYCPPNNTEPRFDAFTYGDARDEGYLLSMGFLLKGREDAKHANDRTIQAIKIMEFWEIYLDNPDELE